MLAGHALAAQDAFDRTNPDQQVERDRPLAPVDETVRIDIQPVLDQPVTADADNTMGDNALNLFYS